MWFAKYIAALIYSDEDILLSGKFSKPFSFQLEPIREPFLRTYKIKSEQCTHFSSFLKDLRFHVIVGYPQLQTYLDLVGHL